MKKYIWLILMIFIYMYFLPVGYAFESDPPFGIICTEDISNYRQYNEYVLRLLDDFYAGVLPDRVDIQAVKKYCYWYQCGLFGEPNFSVYLSLQYITAEEYRAGIGHMEELLQEYEKVKILCNDTYILTGTEQGIEEILDKQILDGLCHRFEIVQYNESAYGVDIFVAQMWDGSVPESQKAILQQFVEGNGYCNCRRCNVSTD